MAANRTIKNKSSQFITGLLTAKGDLLSRDNDTAKRVPVGPDGYVLVADSSNPLGVKWDVAGAASLVPYVATYNNTTDWIAGPGVGESSITIPSILHGKANPLIKVTESDNATHDITSNYDFIITNVKIKNNNDIEISVINDSIVDGRFFMKVEIF